VYGDRPAAATSAFTLRPDTWLEAHTSPGTIAVLAVGTPTGSEATAEEYPSPSASANEAANAVNSDSSSRRVATGTSSDDRLKDAWTEKAPGQNLDALGGLKLADGVTLAEAVALADTPNV